MKRFLLYTACSLLMVSCFDNIPAVEELPSPDVAFEYLVTDDSYQLDYYVGATIEFTSTSAIDGECKWDFGDGTEAVGEVVEHKYAEAGSYTVKLTVGEGGMNKESIFISDIFPIMDLLIESDEPTPLCEVAKTYVAFNVDLPNPEGLSEEYEWVFPEGTLDESGTPITTSALKDPGKVQFSHVGSQGVKLRVKLGGRQLEDGLLNVPVAFSEEVPTLYYAVKEGNIMALKLPSTKPAGMNINPFDMGVNSGQHPLNVLYADSSLYILDCGRQFTYVDDADGVLGDGKITVMSKDGKKVETMLVNKTAAFDDPYYGYIEDGTLYFTNRNTGISTIKTSERNRSYSLTDFPYFVENATLGYYKNGWDYGAMNACIGKVQNTWYWCKTYNGLGLYRFEESDILKEATPGGEARPAAGIALETMQPKSFVYDEKAGKLYFVLLDTGYEGLYACTLNQLADIGDTKGKLTPYKLKTADGKTVTPITESGKNEGSTGEFIGISQLALNPEDGCVYFGLRSALPDEVKSGLMRYNPASGVIEHVIEGVDVYGVSVNTNKSKLF